MRKDTKTTTFNRCEEEKAKARMEKESQQSLSFFKKQKPESPHMLEFSFHANYLKRKPLNTYHQHLKSML